MARVDSINDPRPWGWEPAPQWSQTVPLPSATWTCGTCGDTYSQAGGIDAKEAVQAFSLAHQCRPAQPESETDAAHSKEEGA